MRATEPGQRPAPRRRSTGSSGPKSEAAGGAGYGLRKADSFKRTKPYRGAVRAAYKAQPVAARRATVRATARARTPDARVVQRTHGERHRQFQKDMSGQIINSRQRKVIGAYQRTPQAKQIAGEMAGRARYLRYRPRQAEELSTQRRDIKPSVVGGLLMAPAMVPWRAAKATVQDPRTLPNSAKGLKDILVGTFPAMAKVTAGAVSDARHGRGTLPSVRKYGGDYLKDVAKRYSESEDQMVARFKKKGFAQEAIELSPYGRLIGKGLGKTSAGARVVGKERPALRLSGDHVVRQKTDESVFKAARQHGLDKARRAVTARRPDLLAREAHDAGEVVTLTKTTGKLRRQRMVAQGRVRNKMSEMHDVARDSQTHVKGLVKLSKPERKAFAWAGRGIMHANAKSHRQAILDDIAYHEARIKAGREKHGDKGHGGFSRTDNLKDLAYLRDHIDEAFTERLQHTIRSLHKSDVQLATEDQSLFPMQAAMRRVAQQDQYLRERGIKTEPAAPPEPVVPAKVAKTNGKAATNGKVTRIVDQAAVTRAADRVKTVAADLADAAAQAERIAKNRPETSPVRQRAEARVERLQGELKSARSAATKAKRGTTGKAAKPTPVEEPLVIPTVKDVKNRLAHLRMAAGKERKRNGSGEVSLDTAQAIAHHEQLLAKMTGNGAKAEAKAAVPELKYTGEETDIAHLRRVYRDAHSHGLERPLYFPSEKFGGGAGSALEGDAARAMATSRQYTGKNYATGREDLSPHVYARGRTRAIRRKWNWRLVHDQLDTHAFKSIAGMTTKGKTLGQLRNAVNEADVPLDNVAFYNPGRFQSTVAELRRQGRDITHEEGSFGEALHAAIKEGTDIGDGELGDTGWHVVPRDVLDEIRAETGRPKKLARAWDQSKAFSSRMILGTNPSWLAFQMVSEGAVTAAGVGGRVSAFAKAPLYFRRLDKQAQADIVPWLNAGAAHGELLTATLGPATDSLMARGWRAFEQTKVGHGFTHYNPVQLMMKADHAKSEYLRKVLLYDGLKRQAFHDMGQNAGAVWDLNNRISHIFTLGPEAKMRELLNNHTLMEQQATRLNDVLGDFTTFTAMERKTFRRFAMFYGFLRYSLRLAFYTMPVKHPLMTAIIANLGRMQTEEVRRLLGGDELPWALGRIYWDDNGQLKSLDLQRANPAMNAVTNLRMSTQAVGMLPPAMSIALNQVFHMNSYKDRQWAVDGKPRQHNPQGSDFGLGVRKRIVAEEVLRTIGGYRAAESATENGPQGDDTLLWDQRPTKYVQKRIKHDVAKSTAEQKAEPHRLLNALVGVLPQDSRDPELAARIRENEARKAARGKHKRRKKPGAGYGLSGRGGRAPQGYGIGGSKGAYR